MPSRVLIVDDAPLNLDLLEQELTEQGFVVERASDGLEALGKVESFLPDVILLDYVMPRMDGIEVVRRLKDNERHKMIPVILLTAKGSQEDKVRGLDAGADDYVVKPFDRVELLARVRSAIRMKDLHNALDELNRTLEDKVRRQVAELERLARLKRYLSPQIAETILKGDEDSLFKGHRREVTVVFLDLRGFTHFSDSAEPEEVLEMLRIYHSEMGKLVFKFEGTLERFAGDGIKIFFNDPLPMADHTERAVRMALEMQARANDMRARWFKDGYDLALGIGLASGYATLGEIGHEHRRDYAAVGNVSNLAARLCELAKGGQICTNQRTLSKIEDLVEVQPLEAFHLKGFVRPVPVFNVVRLK